MKNTESWPIHLVLFDLFDRSEMLSRFKHHKSKEASENQSLKEQAVDHFSSILNMLQR